MPPAALTDVGITAAPMSSSGGSSGNSTTVGALSAVVGGKRSQERAVAEGASTDTTAKKSTTTKNKQSKEYVFKTSLAGGLAGCAAKTVVGPIDRVKILFQASSPHYAKYSGSWLGLVTALKEINRTEGARGLFRGHSATLLRVAPYAAIKFVAYEQIRAVLIPSARHETPTRRLLSGSLAGLTGTFFTYPLEMIRVRLAFETKKDSRSSVLRICRQIYHEHPRSTAGGGGSGGAVPASLQASPATAATLRAATSTVEAVTPRSGIANFYRGFVPTLLGILPYGGMSFFTHDSMGDALRHTSVARWTTVPGRHDRYGQARLTNAAELLAGAVSGLVGQTSAYPLEIVRRRMQVGGAIGDGRKLRIAETAARIWAESGWRGFFVGLGIGYTKIVPMSAVGFWTYEKSKQWLGVQ